MDKTGGAKRVTGRRPAAGVVSLLLALSGCSLDKVNPPGLSGPSELALSFLLTATPDVITADGFSTSSIQVLVRNQNGQPVGSQGVFFSITDASGVPADIGRLSATSMATGPNGIAQVIYTAPPRTDATANQSVLITARPIGTDANGQVLRSVRIELRSAEPRQFPPNPANKAPTCSFVVEPATGPYTTSMVVLFQSTSSDSDGTIVRYEWDFGDGNKDDKPDVSHRFTLPGTYIVTQVVTDNNGGTASCTKGLLVN